MISDPLKYEAVNLYSVDVAMVQGKGKLRCIIVILLASIMEGERSVSGVKGDCKGVVILLVHGVWAEKDRKVVWIVKMISSMRTILEIGKLLEWENFSQSYGKIG